ncbi:hypothetical protein M409DRAFT_69991 [Zasmidium cellare ATCC 36951]|uniref:ASST-domain-containing protein n=1 Tax=Zasmidium cellare ATCC 36951 TaxID=1080233 RepID=A0A6A6C4P4_ZASCE|nr:uncharacterized protein M409DRAFT_69991 [Zasmidium cellare ATCC 36951]KAF2161150.1 hypothetical protein M409DRAFT_69991 [Zasmidium cellare ATCC 36951]
MSLAALALLFLSTICLADVTPFYANDKYNKGSFGKYVTQTFKSNPEVTAVPIINFMKAFTNCDDGSYLFVAPRGAVAPSTPMILDMRGSPIWASTKRYGQVYNLQVQQYKGKDYLTFWGGNDAVGGHGIGEYFMLDQHYNEQYRIHAANDLGADLHVFTITEQDTALISIYQKIATDLSSVNAYRTSGWIWDSVFQEIDIETGEAVFQWRASTHIPIANSSTDMNVATENDPWDVYHINSVEKDDKGNYLVSIRFLRAILYISGETGEVLWQLGGAANSFHDLSDGKATTLIGQHDAHWWKEGGRTLVTVFDNQADWYHQGDPQSKGKRIEVDLDNMTARLDQSFTDPFLKIRSTSQGSYQTLPNGNVVLGYGFNGVVSEFSPEGELLCDAYMQPSSTFESGNVQSYRNLKFNWTAWPDTKPALVLEGSKLYISWNGATEVATWLLLGSDEHAGDYATGAPVQAEHDDPRSKRSVEDALVVPKKGFEAEYQIYKDDGLRRYVRVVGLDREGTPLGTSNVVDIGDLATEFDDEGGQYDEDYEAEEEGHEDDHAYLEKEVDDLELVIGFGVLAILSALLILFGPTLAVWEVEQVTIIDATSTNTRTLPHHPPPTTPTHIPTPRQPSASPPLPQCRLETDRACHSITSKCRIAEPAPPSTPNRRPSTRRLLWPPWSGAENVCMARE